MINDELKQSTVIKKGPRWVFHLFTEKKNMEDIPTIGLIKKSKRSTSHTTNLSNNLQFRFTKYSSYPSLLLRKDSIDETVGPNE